METKEKLIKVYRNRIAKAKIGDDFCVWDGRSLENLGIERRVYCGKEPLSDRKQKIEHIMPEAVWLHWIRIDEKNDRRVCVMAQTRHTFNSGEFTEEKPYTLFFGLIKRSRTVEYTFDETILTPTYMINYGSVQEELTQEEYDELIKLALDKHSELLEVSKKKSDIDNDKRLKEDTERLNKKKL